MPWLIKNDDVLRLERCNNNNNNSTDSDDDDDSNSIDVKMNQIIDINASNDTSSSTSLSLFFVHVPRCGGTSLMHYYQLPTKIYKLYKHNYWKQLGMYTFFSRYKTLEISNFPICTIGNAFGLISIILGIYILSASNSQAFIPHLFGILFILFGLLLILLLTIIFTAPVIGRFTYVHHAYLIFVHYILCQFMECKPYCTGTNKSGYMMHLTAYKLLYTYQYVTIPQWNIACSMAIVRNPYSRMISIYTYNRFGSYETFTHFMNDWYHNVTKHYRINHICDEWFTPCHALPQFEYTHYQNQQLVKSIIKQEELKYLKNDYIYNNNTNTNNNTSCNNNNNTNTIVNASNNNNNNNSDMNGDNNENNNSKNNNDTPSNNIDIEITVSTNSESKMDTIHQHHQQQEQQQYEQTTATGEDTAEMGNPNSIITTTSNSNNKTNSTTATSSNTTTTTSDTTTTTTKVLSIHNLPNTVRDALIQMPHTNQRKLSKNIKWYDYYTQHTLDLVYEIYYNDFIIFNYNPILVQRPDLQPPKLYNKLHCNNNHHNNNNNSNGNNSSSTNTTTPANINNNNNTISNNTSQQTSNGLNDIELGVS